MEVASGQIVGMREHQEDRIRTVMLDKEGKHALFMLADGMGGHAAGEIAAELAIDTFESVFRKVYGAKQVGQNAFLVAIEAANERLYTYAEDHPSARGLGTTIVCAVASPEGLTWASVGDSSLFRISPRGIERLNANHSMGSRLDEAARAGQLTWEEAQNNPNRHVLYAALTGEPIRSVDNRTSSLPLAAGDWIVLASDGLETLSSSEVHGLFFGADAGRSADELVDRLLKAVERAGHAHQDNTSLIIAGPFDGTRSNTDDVPTRPILNR